jgi:prophage regulatory protein
MMKTITASAPPRRLVRLPTLRARLDGIHSTTIYRWEQAGRFPRRVVIGPNMVGWYEDEIDAWFAARQRQQDTGRPSPNPRARRAGDLAATEAL